MRRAKDDMPWAFLVGAFLLAWAFSWALFYISANGLWIWQVTQ